MSKLNAEHHLDIEICEDELSEIDFSKDATYGEIKKVVLDKYGLKVSSLYIVQVKRKHGLIERENYNLSKKENQRVPYCPEEKEKSDRRCSKMVWNDKKPRFKDSKIKTLGALTLKEVYLLNHPIRLI